MLVKPHSVDVHEGGKGFAFGFFSRHLWLMFGRNRYAQGKKKKRGEGEQDFYLNIENEWKRECKG